MAVTYLQQADAMSFQSSDDPLVYVFQSDQYLQENFSFTVEVYYDGNLIEKHQVFPERTGGIAQFDASLSVTSRVPPVRRTSTFFTGENLPTLSIAVLERYGATPVEYGFYTSDTCKLVKASTDEDSFAPNWLPTKYTPSIQWLTNKPFTLLKRGNALWCSILNTDPMTRVEVYYYDADDALITVGSSAIEADWDRVTVYLDEAIMTAHIAPVPFTDIKRFEVILNISTSYSVVFTEEDCGEPTQLSWKNNVGGHDQFLFTHNRERQLSNEIREYKKAFGNWVDDPGTGGPYFEHKSVNSGPTHYLKVTEPTGSIHSGWVSEAYQNWLAEIYQSVDVIAVAGTSQERIPVTDTKTTLDKNRFTDTMNFTVNYKKSNFKSINI